MEFMRPADCLLLVRHQGMSASRQLVDWKAVQGAFHKPRRLHLKYVAKTSFFIVLYLIVNTKVPLVKEAVESTPKQNIRGTYILTQNQRFLTMMKQMLT